MNSYIVSIRPKWVENIASGEKTIEVRKSAPKEVPFKAYIYETKESKRRYLNDRFNSFFNNKSHCTDMGKVIGEFICDRIDEYKYVYCDHPEIGYPVGYDCGDNWYDIDDEDLQKACLTEEEFKRYGNGKPLYGWHISDLKIYDNPKELSEFRPICKFEGKDMICNLCPNHEYNGGLFFECRRKVTRPPQSYMRVEELKEV